MAAPSRKISAASARSHTRRKKQASSFSMPTGILTKLSVVLSVGLLALAYQAIQPLPPKICGSSDGPPITSLRIKLKDGRNLSYIETGVPKEKAMYKIIYMHGLSACKYDVFPVSKEMLDEFGIYILSFDRAGYGESDPHPIRSVKSNIQDIEELADQLELGPKFFVAAYSLGGGFAWASLKYIPHRLAGVALVAPASNYWWPNYPTNVSNNAFSEQLVADRWAYRVAHYAPWLTYWWNTQKWFPSSSAIGHNPAIFTAQDKEILFKYPGHCKEKARQQGEFESVYRDWNVALGNWEFDPMDLENPFPNKEGSVHLWHGDEDRVTPVLLSRYISEKLPWVRYHELPGAGHMFPRAEGMSDRIIKSLITGDY